MDDLDSHLARIVVAPFSAPKPLAPSYLSGDGERSPPVAVPFYALENNRLAAQVLAQQQQIDALTAMILGATINLSTVCNPDGSVTNTASFTWGS